MYFVPDNEEGLELVQTAKASYGRKAGGFSYKGSRALYVKGFPALLCCAKEFLYSRGIIVSQDEVERYSLDVISANSRGRKSSGDFITLVPEELDSKDFCVHDGWR
jgi:hypothetical protein